MSNPFIGEIRMAGFNFAPVGWAYCRGQMLAIAQNDALFALIGTTYGGDGVTTFALPDLRGRLPINQGQGPGLGNYVMGQQAGAETVTLLTTQIPTHSHVVNAASDGTRNADPGGNLLGSGEADVYTHDGANTVSLSANVIAPSGGTQPHENMQPFLCINFIIALEGVFPSRN
jgi:microcystin-dependent protein